MTKIEVGYGIGKGEDAFTTGTGAARQAMASISEHRLSGVLVFASARYDLGELLRGILSVVGEGPATVGVTTAGELCDGPRRESVVAVALASPYLAVRVGVGEGVSRDWQQAVAQAVSAPEIRPFFSPQDGSLWPDLTRQGKAAFALLFSPGNTRHADSRSYEILEELKRLSQGRLPIFGGSSADDWRMETNYVLLGSRAYPDSMLVAVFETHLRFGIGLAHGFRPGPQRATITHAQGHEVLELDGKPAAETYAQMLGTTRKALEGKHLTLTTGQPAGTPDPYGQYSINVASYFTPQSGVRFSQPVSEGTILAIMEADQDNMIAAGREALRKALLRGEITNPAVALVCSCALRTRILRGRTGEEIVGMREMVPGVPIVGFYSFGEQGLADDGVNRHNNEVVTVLVLGRELSYAAQVALENERLREELRESEERFRVLVESMDDVVFTLDREQRHTGVFGRWLESHGFTPETFLGKTAREILGAETADVHETANERALAGEHVVYEWSVGSSEGTEHYQTSLSLIRDAEGTVVEIVGRNITELKRVEGERERLIRELEDALAKVKTLRGLLPICASCKKIRDDKGYWTQVEVYLRNHSEARFTHGLCPECAKKLYPDYSYEDDG
jgi:PAS domain S-box-containing protein